MREESKMDRLARSKLKRTDCKEGQGKGKERRKRGERLRKMPVENWKLKGTNQIWGWNGNRRVDFGLFEKCQHVTLGFS